MARPKPLVYKKHNLAVRIVAASVVRVDVVAVVGALVSTLAGLSLVDREIRRGRREDGHNGAV